LLPGMRHRQQDREAPGPGDKARRRKRAGRSRTKCQIHARSVAILPRTGWTLALISHNVGASTAVPPRKS
jgi:hypothetical protein